MLVLDGTKVEKLLIDPVHWFSCPLNEDVKKHSWRMSRSGLRPVPPAPTKMVGYWFETRFGKTVSRTKRGNSRVQWA